MMKLPSLIVLFATISIVIAPWLGCSGPPNGSSPTDGGTDEGGPVPPRCNAGSADDVVTGTFVDTHCTDLGVVAAPQAGTVLTAVVAKPDGTLCEVSATVNAQGDFALTGVPAGPFVLRGTAATPLVTSEHRLELGTNLRGRPDAMPIRTSPTYLKFAVTGLSPVTTNNRFAFQSMGAAMNGIPTFEPQPTPGATSLDGVQADSAKFINPHLIDASRGDHAYLLQMEVDPDSLKLVSIFEPAPFTQEDGKETVLAGAFRQVPGQPVTIALDGPAFETVRPSSEPPPGILSSIVSVIAAAADGSECIIPTTVAIAFFRGAPASVTLTVANPYPSAWPLVVEVRPGYAIQSLVPLDGVTGPIGPLVSAVRELRVNGQGAETDLSGVGTSPTISFAPPTVGNDVVYVIDIVETHVPGVEGGVVSVAQIVTSETSFTIPPGLLRQGAAYVFSVSARVGGSAAAPYRWWRATGYGEAGGIHSRNVEP